MSRTVLITGSSSGIGRGILDAFHAAGDRVIMHGYKISDETLAEAKKKHIRCYDVDISDPQALTHMIDEIGQIDILVNNAGMQHVSAIESFPDERYEMIIALNLSAAFYAMKAVMPSMKKNNFGRMINISSAHGLVASAGKSAYVAAKHGLNGLTKAVALEVVDFDITVNAICPGWVQTPLVDAQLKAISEQHGISLEEATHQLLSEKQPKLSFTLPSDIGAMCVFLASPPGRNMTGTALSMDGGWTAR